jgi:hypothetical protein
MSEPRNIMSLPAGCKPSKVTVPRSKLYRQNFRQGEKLSYAHVVAVPPDRAQEDGELELVVSNTFAAARVPVTVIEGKVEPPVAIPRDVLVHAEKLAGKQGVKLEVMEKHIIPCDNTYKREPVWYERGDFDPLDLGAATKAAMPDEEKHYLEFGINAVLLEEVASALGAGPVRMKFMVDTTKQSQWLKAIEVHPVRASDKTYGLLMPVRLDI